MRALVTEAGAFVLEIQGPEIFFVALGTISLAVIAGCFLVQTIWKFWL